MSEHILLGTQLIAPEGYLGLMKGLVYHFLVRGESIRMVLFEERAPVKVGKRQRLQQTPPTVHLVHLGGKYFDFGIDQGLIVVKPYQDPLPPWCVTQAVVNGTQQTKLGKSKPKKIPRETRIARTLEAYKPLLEATQKIIGMEDPIGHLNKFARSSQPQLNQKRLRAEYFSYILYKQREEIIGYQTQRIGRWDRESHPGRKAGAKAPNLGAFHGFKSSDEQVVKDVREGWEKWAGLGVSFKTIHEKTCAYIWKTTTIEDSKGYKRQARQDGGPFLTYQQFRYRLDQIYGPLVVREKLRGRAYVREKMAPSRGRFSEAVSNVGERTEADGYWINEVILGPDGKNPLPGLVVVRITCVTSAIYLGIGFSFGGESSAAYRMAQFCMAVKKSVFGRMIGMEIDDAEWPSVGLSDDTVTDRGAGRGNKSKASLEIGNPVISSMPPTGFGQGKATIESSHPRAKSTSDRPTHVVTSHSLIDVVRREVLNTVKLNDARDASGRLTPSMLAYLDRATPLDIFNKLSERGRNCLRQISFDDAVRSFLTPVDLTGRADGVYRRYQRYTSDELEKTGVLQIAATTGKDIPLKGYMLDMSTRYCFLEWQGRLIEIAAVLALREDDEQLFISLEQLEQTDKIHKRMTSDLRVHSTSVKVEGLRELTDEAGIPPERLTVKPGSAKRRTEKAAAQAKMLKAMVSHSKEGN